MTSVTKLKLMRGAGAPDSIGPRRLDVVIAAEAFYDAQLAMACSDWSQADMRRLDRCEERLRIAIERLRKARARAAQHKGVA
jgi:hypothetical protein